MNYIRLFFEYFTSWSWKRWFVNSSILIVISIYSKTNWLNLTGFVVVMIYLYFIATKLYREQLTKRDILSIKITKIRFCFRDSQGFLNLIFVAYDVNKVEWIENGEMK